MRRDDQGLLACCLRLECSPAIELLLDQQWSRRRKSAWKSFFIQLHIISSTRSFIRIRVTGGTRINNIRQTTLGLERTRSTPPRDVEGFGRNNSLLTLWPGYWIALLRSGCDDDDDDGLLDVRPEYCRILFPERMHTNTPTQTHTRARTCERNCQTSCLLKRISAFRVGERGNILC